MEKSLQTSMTLHHIFIILQNSMAFPGLGWEIKFHDSSIPNFMSFPSLFLAPGKLSVTLLVLYFRKEPKSHDISNLQ